MPNTFVIRAARTGRSKIDRRGTPVEAYWNLCTIPLQTGNAGLFWIAGLPSNSVNFATCEHFERPDLTRLIA